MASLASLHQRLVAAHGTTLAAAADRLQNCASWSLQTPLVLLRPGLPGSGAIAEASILAVAGLAAELEHLPPELDAFVRLRQQGIALKAAQQQCLAEQGESFRQAWQRAVQGQALVSHDDLARFAALSQRGFSRRPQELLVVVAWPDQVTAFLLACQPRR
ncbi:MAG: hypothetical protein VKI83_06985 [Synechococcaceae cyanobacterium]|nr:hypothetical protein [Synechococcaceae cyanobacterium]